MFETWWQAHSQYNSAENPASDQHSQSQVNHGVYREAKQEIGKNPRVKQHHHRREHEDDRQLVRADMVEERRIAGAQAHAHPGLQQQAKQAELQQFPPLAASDLEETIQQNLHFHSSSFESPAGMIAVIIDFL